MFEDSMADARFLAGKRGQMREKGQKPMPKATKPKISSELEDLLMEQDEEDVFGGDIEQVGWILGPAFLTISSFLERVLKEHVLSFCSSES